MLKHSLSSRAVRADRRIIDHRHHDQESREKRNKRRFAFSRPCLSMSTRNNRRMARTYVRTYCLTLRARARLFVECEELLLAVGTAAVL